MDAKARFIVINESWRLWPAADALYACDAEWWRLRNGVPEFRGLKISSDSSACAQFPFIWQSIIDRSRHEILTERIGIIGNGGNSGFQALNLAVQFGSKKIVLAGYDMKRSEAVHWHGPHERPLKNPSEFTIRGWRDRLDNAAERIRDLGVTVVNVSKVSALQAFPKMSVCEALEC